MVINFFDIGNKGALNLPSGEYVGKLSALVSSNLETAEV